MHAEDHIASSAVTVDLTKEIIYLYQKWRDDMMDLKTFFGEVLLLPINEGAWDLDERVESMWITTYTKKD